MESRIARTVLIVTALLQALALYLLGNAVERGQWPAASPSYLLASYLLATGVPLFVYLSPLRRGDLGLDATAIALVAVILGVMGWHTGQVLAPLVTGEGMGLNQLVDADLVLSAALIVFLSALLFRAWRENPGAGLPWRCQLDAAWGNGLTLVLVAVFVLLLWALLRTWVALFSLIGIDFFRELFGKRPFVYAINGLGLGVGLVLVRTRIGLVTAVRSICEVLARVLLPLAALIVLAFALALPFAGFELLWQEGRQPTALLWLAAFMLFFLNAALGDHGFTGRLRILHWLVSGALVALPVLLTVSLFGLAQRVGVFGWSLGRLWALLVSIALLAYALAALWSLLRYRTLIPEVIGRWNTTLALMLMLLLFAIQSPIADLRRFVAADQLARLMDGRTPAQQFDARYIGQRLGRYGLETLERALEAAGAADPALVQRIEAARRPRGTWPQAVGLLERLPQSIRSATVDEVPESLFQAVTGARSLANACTNTRLDCRIERVVFEGAPFWLLMVIDPSSSTGHRQPDHEAATVAGAETGPWPWRHEIWESAVLREKEGTWEQVGSLTGRIRCRTGEGPPIPDDAAPMIERLMDLPGSALQFGRCTIPIYWHVEPIVLRPAAVIGAGDDEHS